MIQSHRITDIHHHAFPPEAPVHPWNIYTDKQVMEKQGITQIILSCPLPVYKENVRQINLFLAKQTDIYPENYRMLGALPYDDIGAAIEEVSYVLDELKAPGFGINTHIDDTYFSDDRLEPLFEELNRRHALLFLHPQHKRASGNKKLLFTGNDSVYEYTFDTTRAVLDYVLKGKTERWKDIRIILPHAGGTIPFLAHRIAISGEWKAISHSEEQIYTALKCFYYDLTLNHCDRNYQFMKEFVGTDHLLFGTDYPNSGIRTPERDIKTLKETSVFTDIEKADILYSNMEKLLNKISPGDF